MSPVSAPGWLARRPMRLALVVALGVLWLNFLLTTRWAAVDSSINGAKRPFFFAALAIATFFAIRQFRAAPGRAMSAGAARTVAAAGAAFLAVCFFVWFPPASWTRAPFLDDFPLRYQEARDFVDLLRHGAFAGWEWRFLGGYHTSSDVTQGLGVLTYLPMRIFGAAIGFHAAHLLLFAALPLLTWIDLSLDDDRDARVTAVAVGMVCLLAANYSYFLIRSGDTNSLAGVVTAFAAITGAHAARRGRRWGVWTLLVALSLAAFVHAGFFLYASGYLLLDALVARDRESGVRAGAAIVTALIASLPLTWESWRYHALFSWNNLFYQAPSSIDWMGVARKIYYNTELLWLPGRWFNDYGGLAQAILPIAVVALFIERGRVRFHAWAFLATLAVMRLNNPYLGYLFLRPIHMLVVFSAPILAALVVRYLESAALRWSFLAVIALYVQVWLHAVPHVANMREFNAALVDRVTQADGALVLVENNPHRNMNADPGGMTTPSRFGSHFEPLLAAETGRRLYAGGYSDGWQWNPWKGRLVAGGTFMGRALPSTPHDVFAAELRHWGVVDLFVWSDTTSTYLDADTRFSRAWSDGVWTSYRFNEADPREVAVEIGTARLDGRGPLGAEVVLSGVRAGEAVVVRTNFHPAWTARSGDRAIPLVSRDGQLSFDAPCDGDCRVTLVYPARRGLIVLGVLAIAMAGAVLRRRQNSAHS